MTNKHTPQGGRHDDQGRARPPDNLPNPTANTSLSDPGPAPTGGARSAQAGQTMGATRQASEPAAPDEGGLIPEIPWDPTGKIDDEVERRTLGSPKGGGSSQTGGDTGPGRYGGESDEPLSPDRYAGASDNAPTSPAAGATTTLASLGAEDSEHDLRAGTQPLGTPEAETRARGEHPHVEQYGGGGGHSEVF